MYYVKIVENEQQRKDAFTVRTTVFVEEQGIPSEIEWDEFDNTAIHFVVYNENQAIAASRLRQYENQIGKVERVCVLKEYRGQKIGVLIMKEIEQFAIKEGLKKLKLNAQASVVPFYEKLNYVVTSPEFMDVNIPHRAMEKQL